MRRVTQEVGKGRLVSRLKPWHTFVAQGDQQWASLGLCDWIRLWKQIITSRTARSLDPHKVDEKCGQKTTSARHEVALGGRVIAYEEHTDLFHRLLGIGRANEGKMSTHSNPCKH
jgi:hypothetical protein